MLNLIMKLVMETNLHEALGTFFGDIKIRKVFKSVHFSFFDMLGSFTSDILNVLSYVIPQDL